MLPAASAYKEAKKIYDALNTYFVDDADIVIGVFTALPSKIQVAQVAKSFSDYYKRDILEYLKNGKKTFDFGTGGINSEQYNRIIENGGANVTNKIYYVYPVDNNTLRLFSGTTEETDSLNDASRAVIQLTTTGTSPNITISAVTILNQGSGYLSAPVITVSATGAITTPASLTATVTNGIVSSVAIVNGGAYSNTPTASVAMPSTLVDITTSNITGSIKRSSASGSSVPPGREGLYFQNRLLLLYGNDYLAVSDVLDPLHYSPILNEFKLNTGSNDRVVALYPFNMTTLLVFKERSVLAVENLYGDLSTTRLTEITREFGCVSQSSIAGTGSDVIFLSQRGIISLRQTEFGISQSVVVPLSDQIQNIVDDIGLCGDGWQFAIALRRSPLWRPRGKRLH